MNACGRSAGTILAALVATGILASPALADTCAEIVRWNGVNYEAQTARFAVPEPGRRLGEGEVPWCGREAGRCAPPEETVAVFELDGVPASAAIATADGGLLLAPGTFPELPDHPLHEAIYGLPGRPDRRTGGCGPTFELVGTVAEGQGLFRVDVDEAGGQGSELAGDKTWIDVDAQTRIEGLDRDGLPHVEPGDRVRIVASYCVQAEADWPVADLVEPAAG